MPIKILGASQKFRRHLVTGNNNIFFFGLREHDERNMMKERAIIQFKMRENWERNFESDSNKESSESGGINIE